MFGCELISAHPFSWFFSEKKLPASLERVGLSIYYEYCNFYTSTLYFDDGDTTRTIALKRFVSHGFLKKYAHENRVGFKVSYTLF